MRRRRQSFLRDGRSVNILAVLAYQRVSKLLVATRASFEDPRYLWHFGRVVPQEVSGKERLINRPAIRHEVFLAVAAASGVAAKSSPVAAPAPASPA